ncbi:NAD(P)/FAD-dependent oxidoreductase [Pseudonocardia sp.]|uniref:NAD(P)/FAD-dependent oxidoreductase n=1 Tax=Pseudonocardia sp. TaxID=60912 RepID=UPI003D0F7198
MSTPAPERVAVVGAGMVGLACAWYLQEHGVDVTVVERDDVAAGSSWGNAGWLTPGIATPLPEPAVLRYGLRAVLSPGSPVYVPPTADPQLLRFLAGFARNCTMPRWRAAMDALVPLNAGALDAFARIEAGLPERTRPADPFLAAYRTSRERETLLQEIEHIRAAGQDVEFDLLDGDEARSQEPALAPGITAAIRLRGQRFLDPAPFVHALADDVVARGGTIVREQLVDDVTTAAEGVTVGRRTFDAVVLATGARLGTLARRFGVRRLVQAGRGYSFTVKVDQLPRGPVYFPAQRVACTPARGRLRVAGMMEFRPVDAAPDPRRIQALVDAASQLLDGADLEHREDEWVGARPCTVDGLPLVGRTADPRVFVAGGHGMWGIALGPVTGRLLAEQIATGSSPAALAPLDPLR